MVRPKYYAHSAESAPRDRWHPLAKHLEDTASRAAAFLMPVGGAEFGYAAGLLHDLGKYRDLGSRLPLHQSPISCLQFGDYRQYLTPLPRLRANARHWPLFYLFDVERQSVRFTPYPFTVGEGKWGKVKEQSGKNAGL